MKLIRTSRKQKLEDGNAVICEIYLEAFLAGTVWCWAHSRTESQYTNVLKGENSGLRVARSEGGKGFGGGERIWSTVEWERVINRGSLAPAIQSVRFEWLALIATQYRMSHASLRFNARCNCYWHQTSIEKTTRNDPPKTRSLSFFLPSFCLW